MKAAILNSFGSPLVIEELADPSLGTGEVIVDVHAAPILSYMNEVVSGERNNMLNLPLVPGAGAIGQVRAVGPDSTRLAIGDWVFCDPTVRSRDDSKMPDITLLGLNAREEGGLKLQNHFRHGSFAEQMMIPTENSIRLGSIEKRDALKWSAALGSMLVPYGGLLAAKIKAGETLLVSGATGNFGSACIAVALAMGIGRVVATGRNEKTLEDLSRRFGSRVCPVKITGNEEEDRKKMQQAAEGPIDCVFDILPPMAEVSAVRAAVMSVRPYGRVVLMGGVGMLGGPGLELPYPWIMRNCITILGNWLYTVEVPSQLVSLFRSNLSLLDQFDIKAFHLNEVNDAIDYASSNSGSFKMTVLEPQKTSFL